MQRGREVGGGRRRDMERRPARSAAKNTRRNKLKGDVHYIDTTYLAVLSYTFILILLLLLLLLS